MKTADRLLKIVIILFVGTLSFFAYQAARYTHFKINADDEDVSVQEEQRVSLGGQDISLQMPDAYSVVSDDNLQASTIMGLQGSIDLEPLENIAPDSLNVLVDKEHSLPSDYEPQPLVSLSSIGMKTYGQQQMRKDAADKLKQMSEDMKKEGFNIYVISAYRSYAKQEYTHNYWINMLGVKEAKRTSAEAGHSEHQLGTTVDISNSSSLTSIYKGEPSAEWTWLDENAHFYGFVMSYRYRQEEETGYKFEPWHWRYVGKDLASEIRHSTNTPQSYYEPLDN